MHKPLQAAALTAAVAAALLAAPLTSIAVTRAAGPALVDDGAASRRGDPGPVLATDAGHPRISPGSPPQGGLPPRPSDVPTGFWAATHHRTCG
ncbi:hypothetical protein ACFU3O_14695 [Streptomyces antibioticus]|uniref:hypothetical protein n=1 Tax=Streptomyces antibioticus TaxID=1890 RepID=UPI003685FF6C